MGDGYNRESGALVRPVADMDVFASTDRPDLSVVEDLLDRLDLVSQKYLTEDERLVLDMRRGNMSLEQMSNLLGIPYGNGGTIGRALDSVVKTARFFAEHLDVFEGEQDPMLKAYARGEPVVEIADDNGVSRSTVQRRIATAIENNPHGEVYREVGRIRRHVRTRWKEKKMPKENWRDEFVELMRERIGKVWYVWGGQDLFRRSSEVATADCSGLIHEVLKELDVLPRTFPDMTAHKLRQHFSRRTTKPQPGDLAFYGRPNRVVHVMFHLGKVEELNSDRCVVGMAGGGRSGMTSEQAQLLGVGLWVRTSPRYRRDFLGYRKVQ